jgi:hypothetical protein
MPNTSIAYVHEVGVAHSFSESLAMLIVADIANPPMLISEVLKNHGATGMIDECRNIIVREFLDRKTEDEWLFFVDTDMGFKPDTHRRLIEAADPERAPIMGALCFVQKEFEFDGYQGYKTIPRPTIFDKSQMKIGDAEPFDVYLSRGWYPSDAVVQCGATGMACVVIHRSVFEKIGEGGWYDRFTNPDGSRMGEDISFCIRCAEKNIPIHVHTGVKTTHMKTQWVSDQDFWTSRLPPPALERTVVLVPVLHRPQNAEPFMTSLRASTGLCDVVAIADEDDSLTIGAWLEQGAIVLKGPEHTFAEKVNRAYRETAEWPVKSPWVFITGDDVQFHPGWLDHAQWVADQSECAVIGTNDLGNPRVIDGKHGTHLLIRRDYIDREGASWDGPGVLAHTGYRHWCVDDEIVTAAKQRALWMAAPGSHVEHLHPYWDKGAMDSTYQEGERHNKHDVALFKKRLEANA